MRIILFPRVSLFPWECGLDVKWCKIQVLTNKRKSHIVNSKADCLGLPYMYNPFIAVKQCS